MKHALIIAAVAIALPALGASQAKPDFSGTWTFDEVKSDPAPQGAGRGMAPATLIIKQSADEITIEQAAQPKLTAVYKLDNTESVNKNPLGEVRSKTRWDGDKLVTEGTRTLTTQQGTFDLVFRDIRSLNADGAMVIENSTDTPIGNFSRKIVYTKKP
jgi:hypothetical protein